ncbi:hypothetical protein ACFP1C_00170 [Levilactobacillus fujinensis]|uniref:Uncharacterized protein n=1 Tax=Levilactobacillus fujinensis TaxID=2486024 RepID=A0ABW1TBV0_9LACO
MFALLFATVGIITAKLVKTAALRPPGIPLAVGNASSQRTSFQLA